MMIQGKMGDRQTCIVVCVGVYRFIALLDFRYGHRRCVVDSKGDRQRRGVLGNDQCQLAE